MIAFVQRMVFTVALIFFSMQNMFAQESMLAFKFSPGQNLRYKVTSNGLLEGGMFPNGRVETLIHLYYTLNVTAVDNEGTATVTFTQDSLLYWEDSMKMPYTAGEQLNGVPVAMWFSNRGMIVDVNFPADLSKEAEQYLDGVLKDFGSEPPLPGSAKGVGAEWKNDLSVYFVYGDGMAKVNNPSKALYARKENIRGKECARIEYGGNLISVRQKVGSVSGTIHHSLRDGKILRVSSKTDATIYMPVRGARAQARISTTQTREALN